jgi:paraquat-inducible protein B
MAEGRPELGDIPEAKAVTKSHTSLQIVWLIPLIAVLIGGWLAVKTVMERGPTITITFKTAEGLEAGKTKIKYKDVDIGLVKSIVLSPDLDHVVATADLVKEFAPNLVDDLRFWVVRARISGGTISGLGTLLSGSYIGVGVGKSDKPRSDFVGLETPPVVSIDTPGRQFTLRAANMGSLDVGSPIFYRRLQAGQVMSYAIDPDGKGVTLDVFINSPFDKFVNDDTRFWNASGVDIKLDSNGVKIDTQSMVSILVGGIAFETPDVSADLPALQQTRTFALFDDRTKAMQNPETTKQRFVLIFHESVRGLEPGAVVDFLGINIGEVVAIKVTFDEAKKQVTIPVEVDLYPTRLQARWYKKRAVASEKERIAFVRGLIARGLRAQLRTGNLLTGQLYIGLDFFPNAPKAGEEVIEGVPELPTLPSSMRELQDTIASIANKIEKLPLAEISGDLRQTLQTGTKLMQRLDSELAPEMRGTLDDARKALVAAEKALASDSQLQQDAREAMREVARAAKAIRLLADTLERNPEALIRGKPEEGK